MMKKIAELIKLKKSGKLLFIAGLIGIVLIYASTLIPEKDTLKGKTLQTDFSQEEYRCRLEEDVKEIVKAICLDSAATVTVTLEGGITFQYADEKKQNSAEDESKTNSSSEQKLIIVKGADGAETPLLITTRMPKVRGVSIICNASDEKKEEIKKAVTAALDISSRKVYIGNKGGE